MSAALISREHTRYSLKPLIKLRFLSLLLSRTNLFPDKVDTKAMSDESQCSYKHLIFIYDDMPSDP